MRGKPAEHIRVGVGAGVERGTPRHIPFFLWAE
jgi:hypothetical protein